jgi:hypothetical protein
LKTLPVLHIVSEVLPSRSEVNRITSEVASIDKLPPRSFYSKEEENKPDPKISTLKFPLDNATLLAATMTCRRPQWLPLAVILTMVTVWTISKIPWNSSSREDFQQSIPTPVPPSFFHHIPLPFPGGGQLESVIRVVRDAIRRGDMDALKIAIARMRQALVDRYSRSAMVSWSLGVAALLYVMKFHDM